MARRRSASGTSVRWLAGVLGAALATGLLPSAEAVSPVSPATAVGAPDVVTVPLPGPGTARTTSMSGGVAGVWVRGTGLAGGGWFRPTGSATFREVPTQLEACTGRQQVLTSSLSCVVDKTLGLVVDLTDDSVSTVTFPAPGTVLGSGGGFVGVQGTSVVRYRPGQLPVTVRDLAQDGYVRPQMLAADGVVIVSATNVSSGAFEVLTVEPDHVLRHGRTPSLYPLVGSGRIALSSDRRTRVIDARSGAEIAVVDEPVGARPVALSSTGIVFVGSTGQLHTAPVGEDGTVGPVVELSTEIQPVVQDGPDFMVLHAGGLGRIVPGASDIQRSESPVRRQATGLALAPGRLAVLDTRAYRVGTLSTRVLSRPGDPLSVSGPADIDRLGHTIAASAGRTVLEMSTDGRTWVSDRGLSRELLPDHPSAPPVIAGSVLLMGGQVLRPDGAVMDVLEGSDPATHVRVWATDGRYVVWRTVGGSVWLRDLALAATAPGARRLLEGPEDCAAASRCVTQVAVGSGVVALVRSDGTLMIGPVTGGPERSVGHVRPDVAPVIAAGLLTWAAPGADADVPDVPGVTVQTVRVSEPGATPVVLGEMTRRAPGRAALLAGVEDLVAWVAPDGLGRLARVPLATTPWRAIERPVTTIGLSPNGDGVRDSWPLTVDLDQGGRAADVVVRSSTGAVVRRLTDGTGDGSVRVSWDGRDTAQRPVPDGRYTWRLELPGASPEVAEPQPGVLASTSGSVVVQRSLT